MARIYTGMTFFHNKFTTVTKLPKKFLGFDSYWLCIDEDGTEFKLPGIAIALLMGLDKL